MFAHLPDIVGKHAEPTALLGPGRVRLAMLCLEAGKEQLSVCITRFSYGGSCGSNQAGCANSQEELHPKAEKGDWVMNASP